jgi:hypothetical protein
VSTTPASDQQSEGIYEIKKETSGAGEDVHKRWMAEIDLAGAPERQYRKEGAEAVEIYRSEGRGSDMRFNILFSNVETAVPALYNSTPIPDVRTRYHEDDETARLAGQVVERALSYAIDNYDFDNTIRDAVLDRELVGRGAARVRYKPTVVDNQVYQEVTCEHVPWKNYLIGPAMRWEDVPWIAFEQFLTRDQLMTLDGRIGGLVNLDFHVSEGKRDKADAAPNVYKRARVWEIWDKQTRKVYWIAPGYKAGPIRVDDDPLGLVGFFPMPFPVYAIRTPDSLTPVPRYRILKPLIDELEELTVRIQALVRVCKWRGFRHPAIPFERLEEAEDGELVAPLDGGEMLALVQGAGLQAHIWTMPLKEVVEVIQSLSIRVEQVKGTIFEVSGMADIMRGQSNPNETLGAQEIKANFGTMRMQHGQRDVQRFCRDLMRIKAEIICSHFEPQNLALVTGIKLPPREQVQMAQQQLQQMQMAAQQGQQVPPPPPDLEKTAKGPAWEDVLDVLKSDVMRAYRIDIETDSTVRGDLTQAQNQAGQFLQGMAQFVQAIGPAIQGGFMQMDVAADLFGSLARNFKLGKQAEDALARLVHTAQEQAKNPAPPQPSPEEIKAQAEQKKAEMGMQQAQQKHGMQMQALNAKMQADMAGKQMELEAKKGDLAIKAAQAELDQKSAYAKFAMEQEQARRDDMDHLRQAAIDEHMATLEAQHAERRMSMDEAAQQAKHFRELMKPAPTKSRN